MGEIKQTDLFDKLDNVIGNYISGSATEKDIVKIAILVNQYLRENPHPHALLKTKYQKHDIVVVKNKIVQYLGDFGDSGGVVQDIHTRRETTKTSFIERKATKDEVKWFCENTKNSEFKPPLNTDLR